MMPRLSTLVVTLLLASLVAQASELLDAARGLFEAGKYSQAIDTLQAALAKAPQDARLNYWLARCYYELREDAKTVTAAERAARLDPGNSEYQFWLGKAYGAKADRENSFSLARKTKAAFEEAVRLDPRHIRARRALAEYYTEAPWIVGGGKDKARQQIEALAALDPVEGHLARADYWEEEKKPELAEAEYRQVLALEPNRIEPYLDAAWFYIKRRNAAQAETAVEAAARVKDSDPRLAYFRGVVRVLEGKRLAEAEEFLKSYLLFVPPRQEYPSQASAREWLGRLYEQLGKREEAAAEYRAALQLDPGRKAAREGLRRVGKQL